MISGKLFAGAAMPSLMGPMTSIERERGRYLRAPDHGDTEFEAFEKAGEVEVGSTVKGIESNVPDEPEPKPEEKKPSRGPKTKAAEKPAEKPKGKDDEGQGDETPKGEDDEQPKGEDDEAEEDEEEKAPKPKKKASERIQELTKRVRDRDRLIDQLSTRLDALEKGGLPAGGNGGNTADAGRPAPDPNGKDSSGNPIYPLGHLDDRYIEDKLDWLAEQKAARQADAVLLRQQEDEQKAQAEQAQAKLLEKVDDLRSRGSDISDDFEENVIEAGIRGDWKLDQPTFDAAYEAENGAQILYELSQDKKEAARVASLSPFQQMKFVMDRDAEISAKSKPRTKPKAGEPPQTNTRGANSSARINPATDDLRQFERAWIADEKGQ